MNLKEIIEGILAKPDIPRYYRELKNFYLSQNMLNEVEALQYLLETKFHQNDKLTDNNQE